MSNGILLDMHYEDPRIGNMLKGALQKICSGHPGELLFICIGTDRHILDCFGPLIGSMVRELNPQILIYGQLNQPLHAKNITKEMETISSMYTDSVIIAIDASVGDAKDFGNIKMRMGPIIPGKALARKLPPIGDYAITGVMGNHLERYNVTMNNQGSLAPVYAMAKIIAEAICQFHEDRVEE